MLIRAALPHDLAVITGIYDHAVRHGTASFELQPPDQKEMTRRYEALLAGGYPYLVAEIEGEIAGYAYAGPYRARPAYHWSVEDSIYVAPQSHRRGVGRALIERLIADAAGGRLPADDRGDRGFRQYRLDRASPLRRLPHGGYVRQCRLQVRTLARQRPDAAPAWGRCDDRSLEHDPEKWVPV